MSGVGRLWFMRDALMEKAESRRREKENSLVIQDSEVISQTSKVQEDKLDARADVARSSDGIHAGNSTSDVTDIQVVADALGDANVFNTTITNEAKSLPQSHSKTKLNIGKTDDENDDIRRAEKAVELSVQSQSGADSSLRSQPSIDGKHEESESQRIDECIGINTSASNLLRQKGCESPQQKNSHSETKLYTSDIHQKGR